MKRYPILLMAASLLFSGAAESAKYKAPAAIIASLPQYCWSQYVDGLEKNPAYQIQGCGVYTNHFCPGLVEIAQARTAREPARKKELLQSAKKNMEYTLHFTEQIPSCMLRPEAQAHLNTINMKLQLMK